MSVRICILQYSLPKLHRVYINDVLPFNGLFLFRETGIDLVEVRVFVKQGKRIDRALITVLL